MLEDIWIPLTITIKVAFISTVCVAVLGIIISYILARREFKGKWAAETLVTLPLVLPPTVTGYLLVILLGKNGIIGQFLYELTGWALLFTWQAAVVAAFVVSLPLMIKTAVAAIAGVDRELEYAAYTLGNNELETMLFVTLPLAKKGILAGLVLSFARAVGEFGATLMVAGNIPGKTNTMALSIYTAFQSGDDALANTLVIILVLVSLLAMILTAKFVDRWSV
jgi:molybdate transport system permease protein